VSHAADVARRWGFASLPGRGKEWAPRDWPRGVLRWARPHLGKERDAGVHRHVGADGGDDRAHCAVGGLGACRLALHVACGARNREQGPMAGVGQRPVFQRLQRGSQRRPHACLPCCRLKGLREGGHGLWHNPCNYPKPPTVQVLRHGHQRPPIPHCPGGLGGSRRGTGKHVWKAPGWSRRIAFHEGGHGTLSDRSLALPLLRRLQYNRHPSAPTIPLYHPAHLTFAAALVSNTSCMMACSSERLRVPSGVNTEARSCAPAGLPTPGRGKARPALVGEPLG
jgi:hypothetical protein